MSNPRFIAEMIPDSVKQAAITGSLDLRFGDCVIKVESNHQPLLDDLRQYFHQFVTDAATPAQMTVTAIEQEPVDLGFELEVKQPDPGKTKIKEEFLDLEDGRLVRKRLTGMIFVFGPDAHLAFGPCLENSNQVINFVNNRLIQWELDRGCLLAHAAAVIGHGKGMALAGFSGMGKSTLALHMMSLGADFVSNDRLLFKNNGQGAQMIGVAKLPRINPGTALNNPDLAPVMPTDDRERFAKLPPEELWPLEHKYDVDIDECFGPGRFILDHGFDALGLLNWQRDGGPLKVEKIDIAERLDLLEAFKKSPGLFFLPGNKPHDYSDASYVDAMQGVTVYELSGGADFLQAAQICLDKLKDL